MRKQINLPQGVTFHHGNAANGKPAYRVRLRMPDGSRRGFGYYSTAEDAARKYVEACVAEYGQPSVPAGLGIQSIRKREIEKRNNKQ